MFLYVTAKNATRGENGSCSERGKTCNAVRKDGKINIQLSVVTAKFKQ